MSRPSRMTTANLKKYAEMNESAEDSDIVSLSGEDDSDFDDDEDPDKIEVPGGGSTLENACKVTPSGSSKVNKVQKTQTVPIHPSLLGGSQLPKFNLPEGTSIRPSQQQFGGGGGGSNMMPLFDPSAFLTNPFNTNPLESLGLGSLNSLNALLKMFPTNKGGGVGGGGGFDPMQANQLMQFYSLLAGNPSAMNLGAGGMPPSSRGQSTQQMWSGGQGKMEPPKLSQEEDEIHDEDDEALGVAETYADYVPAKLKIGKSHPDPIVETASLSSVAPPEVYYKLKLPTKIVDRGLLSALQLEAVVYACQQHEFFLRSGQRAGYLVGDGAGVGKGRTIAGIIYENWLSGRKKAIWVSVSADLKEDSIRDLKDIGAGKLPVFALNKLKYGRISKLEYPEGILFSTYSGLIGESSTGGKFNARYKQIVDWLGPDFDGLIVFDECHRAKNLCPVGNTKPTKTGVTVQNLQEAFPKARVVYASATGASEPKNMAYMTRLGIWGHGTPFVKFSDFIHAVEKRGIGAMEIVAMDMKLRGAYIARQLSFKGVAFTIEEVSLNSEFIKMYNESVDLWVEAMQKFIEAAALMKADKLFQKTMWGQFWASHQRFFKYLCIAGKVNRAIEIAREAVKDGKCVVIGLQSTGEARTAEQVEKEGELDDFVSTSKGVFQSLVEKHLPAPDRTKIRRLLGIPINDEEQAGSSSGKGKPMRKAAQNAAKRHRWGNESDASSKDDIDSDFSAAAGSPTDSEVSTDPQASDSEFDSVSSDQDSDDEDNGKGKRGRKRKQPKKKKNKSAAEVRDVPSKQALDRAFEIRKELLEKIEKLGDKMPTNTLDHLIDELGGPSDVAEMTGRKMRLIQVDSGKIEYQSRAESDVALDHINLTEKQRFMDGVKNIAIISEAASSGISLQSDRRALNKRRRVHITLELPWSADRAIQQFGRTHRSNQVNAPEYVFLISDLAGENRFASIVAKRLESLGALTHGDRRATETRDLSRFHIDNKYGKQALEAAMRYIMFDTKNAAASPPADFEGDFRNEVAEGLVGVGLIISDGENLMPEKDYNNMSKFLNRILGMHVKIQNALFKFFTDTLTAIVANAKKLGRFDMGILNLGDSTADKTSLTSTQSFSRKHATGSATIECHEVVVERGMSWEEARAKADSSKGAYDGFYLQREEKNGKRLSVLVVGDDYTGASSSKGEKVRYYTVYRPSTGMQLRRETISEIRSKYNKSTPEKVTKSWEDQFEDSGKNCVHAFWSGNCKNRAAGLVCDIGKRQRTYFVLSGSVLLCWDDVEKSMASKHVNHKIQIVRAQFRDGVKFVGILIPGDCVENLKARLKQKEQDERQAEALALKGEDDDDEDEENQGGEQQYDEDNNPISRWADVPDLHME